VAEVTKDKSVPLADKQAAVAAYLAQLPALLNAVRALMGTAPVAQAPAPVIDPIAAIAALKPASFKSSDPPISPGGVPWPVIWFQQLL
jgi:hypothetical protein